MFGPENSYSWQKPARFYGPVFFLWFAFFSSGLLACSLEDFVPAEFTDRCRRLLQNLETGLMATRMESPAAADYIDRLAADWVDFHLDHGASPPPLYTGIATESWASASWRIGQVVAEVAGNQWPEAEIEEARFLLKQMCEPSSVEKNRMLLASWTAALLSDPGQELETFGAWVEKAYLTPLREIDKMIEKGFPQYQARTKRLMSLYEEDTALLRRTRPEVQREMARSLVERWRQQLRVELDFWKTRLLW